MRKISITLFALILMAGICLPMQLPAQAPQKMSYQSVIRDGNGDLVTDNSIGIRIQILQGTQDGAPVYVETHTTTTNANGLASLAVGEGNTVSGAIAGIDWADGPYFIKTETDPTGGDNYTIAGTSELLSVPYAFFANRAAAADNTNGGSTATYSVGDIAMGGIVFYVNADGTHGLVAATQDQAKGTNWYTAPNNLSNPANHNDDGKMYTDWRLPTRYELNLMYTVLKSNGLAGFGNEFYWSATEDDSQNSWRQDFTDGRQALINKNAPNSVRAVRSF